MATTKCPYCGASLDLKRAENGLITCEYCDSEVQVKTGSAPPVRGPVITGAAPFNPNREADLKKWKKTMFRWAVIQCTVTAFAGILVSNDQGLGAVLMLAAIITSFVLPFTLGAKFPPAQAGEKTSKGLAGLGVYGSQFLGFWAGMIIAAMFEM